MRNKKLVPCGPANRAEGAAASPASPKISRPARKLAGTTFEMLPGGNTL